MGEDKAALGFLVELGEEGWGEGCFAVDDAAFGVQEAFVGDELLFDFGAGAVCSYVRYI